MDILDEVDDPLAVLERSPAWKLTNDQLFILLEKRASEYKVQKALKQLIKAFQLEASRSPKAELGLRTAIGLAEFWLTHIHGGSISEYDRAAVKPVVKGRPVEGSAFSRLRAIVEALPVGTEFTNKEILQKLDPNVRTDSSEASSLTNLLLRSENIERLGKGRYVKRSA